MKAHSLSILFITVAMFQSCANYTSEPVCSEANAGMPDGITGTYTLATQDPETFEVEVQEIVVGGDKGFLAPNSAGRLVDSASCVVNGWFVAESYNEEVQGYEQTRFSVTNLGIQYAPILYDRSTLEDLGIRTKVIQIPGLSSLITHAQSFGIGLDLIAKMEGTLSTAMKIDNAGVAPSSVFEAAHTGPLAAQLLRR